jgi:hypothetical protein
LLASDATARASFDSAKLTRIKNAVQHGMIDNGSQLEAVEKQDTYDCKKADGTDCMYMDGLLPYTSDIVNRGWTASARVAFCTHLAKTAKTQMR